ncbi:PAS domain S-box protein, partial [bacterium]
MAGYSFLLALAMFVLFIRLFIRFPQHRWPAVLILAELLLARCAVLLDYMDINPVAPIDFLVLIWNVSAILYAAVLFGFRIFDEIALARRTAIEQMHAGMLVVDMQGRVASLNPAAQAILGSKARHFFGTPILDILPEYASLVRELPAIGLDRVDISRRMGSEIRYFTLATSDLKDWLGVTIGRLLLLLDVTEQRLTQRKLVEQQRALAMLQERERLARELHDSIGQVLGYVGFQVDAVTKLVTDGKTDAATEQLDRLAGIAREAHADIREFILDLHAAPAPEKPFFTALGNYLDGFTHNYDIQTILNVDERLIDEPFPPDSRVQIFRILQEALSNARKHGHAHSVQ